jgi:hypothetical protein
MRKRAVIVWYSKACCYSCCQWVDLLPGGTKNIEVVGLVLKDHLLYQNFCEYLRHREGVGWVSICQQYVVINVGSTPRAVDLLAHNNLSQTTPYIIITLHICRAELQKQTRVYLENREQPVHRLICASWPGLGMRMGMRKKKKGPFRPGRGYEENFSVLFDVSKHFQGKLSRNAKQLSTDPVGRCGAEESRNRFLTNS